MKSTRTLITIVLLFTAVSLVAQTTPSQRLMKVNVPFTFGVEGHAMPAGEVSSFLIRPAMRSGCSKPVRSSSSPARMHWLAWLI
jgi:hypothetical protein